MRVTVAQVNATPGDWETNMNLVTTAALQGMADNADLVVLPELVIPGYGYRDEYHRSDVIDKVEATEQKLEDFFRLHEITVPVVFGSLERQTDIKYVPGIEDVAGKPFNVGRMWYMDDGALVKQTVYKSMLPNDGVFDEVRTFTPGPENQQRVFRLPSGQTIALVVCAELWNPDWLAPRITPVDLIVSINASDWHPTKIDTRVQLAKEISTNINSPVLYVNMVAGQDGILFDGASFLVISNEVESMLPEFEEVISTMDLNDWQTHLYDNHGTRLQRVRKALVFGLKEYLTKNGFPKVVLGLSGGIDSALVAVLAAEATGKENVMTIALPTKFNADESQQLAEILAHNLGVGFMTVPIQEAFETMDSIFQDRIAPGFGVAQENLQSRIRANVLMGYANGHNAINLGGGNKSEAFVGYSTLFGDLAAGYFPIADVCKTDVYALCKMLNEEYGYDLIPERIITRPPSAELAEGQVDSNELPPYDVVDAAMRVLVEGSDEYVDPGQMKRLRYLFDRSEYKRKVLAPLTKVTLRSFGPDWRKPITRRWG